MTQFPPLYPLVIAAISLLADGPLEGARWLSVILYFEAIHRPYLISEEELQAAAPFKVTAVEGVRFYQTASPPAVGADSTTR